MSRLRNIVGWGGVVVVAALLTGGCPGQGPGTDDDRPPIIVSDGSVHMRVVAKTRGLGTNKSRGAWMKNGNNQWYHDQGGPPAKRMLVNVLYGSGGANCQDPEYDFDVRDFTVTYTDGTNDTTFKIFIDAANANAPGPVTTDASGAPDGNIPFWFDVGTPEDRLKSVTFGSLNVTCDLAPRKGQIHIYARPN